MSDTTFSIDLALTGTPATKEAAEAIEKLRGSVENSTRELGKMRAAYSGLKIGGQQNTEMGKALKEQIDKTRKSIGAQTAEGLKMKGWLSGATKSTKELGAEQKKAGMSLLNFGAAAQLGGGPVAQLAAKTSTLSSGLGKAGLVGAALAGVVAIVALDVALIKATFDIAKFAVGTADAYRSENLSIQGMTKVWRGFWGFMQPPAGNANSMQSSIDEVAQKVPLARSKIVELNAELYKYRLRGSALTTALLAVAQGESAAGAEGKQMGLNMVVGAAMWGRSINGAANIMNEKFGGIVKQQMLALPVQLAKIHENFGALFRGLNVTPLLEGLRKTMGFLDQGSVGFNAWKQIFESLFNPLFGGAKSAGDLMEHFFNRITILALDAQYGWIKTGGSIRLSAFGVKNYADLLARAIRFGGSLAVAMLRTAQATLFVADSLGRCVTILQTMWNSAMGVGKAIGAIFGASSFGAADKEFQSAAERFGEIAAPNAATSGIHMLEGIIDGIRESTPKLVGAVGEAMDAANAEVVKKQQMHSPSLVWKGFARNMALGATNEFRAQTPNFARAAGAMASVQPMAPRAMGGGNVSSKASVSIGDVHLHGQVQGDMVTMPIGEFKRMLALCVEGMAIHKGAPIGAAA